jgi:ketosteroid isomerase-like protein
MKNVQSPDEIRKVAMALDRALENKNLDLVTSKFADDCSVELLNVKLVGKEGVKKWFNWLFKHVAEIRFTPVTIMVEGDTFFEEYIVNARLYDGEQTTSKQAEVLVFENYQVKTLRIYFDRLDFASSVAKNIISKTIVKELIKKSIDDLI